MIRWLLPHTRGLKRELLAEAVAPGAKPFHFEWLPYDWETNGPDVPLDWRVYTPTW